MFSAGNSSAVALIAGAVAGVCCDVRAGDALAVAVALGTGALALDCRTARTWLAYLSLAALSCGWAAMARDRALAPPLAVWFAAASGGGDRTAGPVLVDGVIAADAAPAAGGVRLALHVAAVLHQGRWRPAEGHVQAHVSGELALAAFSAWTAGRRVRVPITLRQPQMLRNFGGPSPRLQMLRRPFALLGTIKSAALMEVTRAAWWDEAAAGVRRHVRDSSVRFVAPHASGATAIVNAIVIGDRAGLSDEVERRLQNAGVYHVIAISGGNVALLTALCFGAIRLIIRSARLVAAATLVLVLVYGWVVGGDPSVARAVTAASLYLALSLAGLQPRAIVILRTTAVVLVALDPLIVIDVGAWLSFGATLGIVTLVPRGAAVFLGQHPPGRFPLVRWVGVVTSATLAVEAVLLPVTALVFARVSVAGVLLNLVAIPAMAVVQVAGGVAAVGAWVHPGMADLAGATAGAAAGALVWSCSLVEVWPWLAWRVPPSSAWWLLGYYSALAASVGLRGWRRRLGAAALLTVLGVILLAPGLERAQPARGRLRLTILDVGQGDALLLQAPGGRALLVDAGGAPGPFDIGERVVTPAIWALGVRRLDWFALSHGDRDHAGGALPILRDLHPREIWEGVPVPPDVQRAKLRAAASAAGISWRTVQSGARLDLGDVSVETLHPPPPDWERQRVRNDDSLVLRIRYGRTELWLTGDAGEEFERRGLPDAARSAIRILKVGHHGSRTSSGEAFVAALRPHVAIISAGRSNAFGHPAPEILDRLIGSGAAIFRTDEDGGVVVESDGEVVAIQTATGRRWVVSVCGS